MPDHLNISDRIADYQAVFSPTAVVPNRRVPAWLLSFLFHTLMFVIMLVALRTAQRGASEVENRTGGIVLVDAKSETTEYLTEGEVEDSSSQPTTDQSPPPLAANSELPPDLPGLESALTPITGAGDQLAESLPGAESLIEGSQLNRDIGGKITTEVFGIKGTGSRFVYVFDRSKSMEGYQARPLMAARLELLKSLQSLGSNHQFQIVFYNDEVRIFQHGGLSTMCFATDDNKEAAREFVDSVRGDSGTDHLNALKHAFKLDPDVIFLLTDAEGGFSAAELRDVSDFNRSAAIINAIEFGERRGGDKSLERLARESGGQYVFKNIRTLQIDNK